MAANVESEMEEGEIVDELDDLSDISSEEEFLLRQRLEVLENYNNVLERKKAKRTSIGSGIRHTKDVLYDLSEISGTEFDDAYINSNRLVRPVKHSKHTKPKRRKDEDIDLNHGKKRKEYRKKSSSSQLKKKLGTKVISESSEESEDEYRNKRRKLANAVLVYKNKTDKSTLSDRLKKMMHPTHHLHVPSETPSDNCTETNTKSVEIVISSVDTKHEKAVVEKESKCTECIEINESSDDDVKVVDNEQQTDVVDGIERTEQVKSAEESEEDLELLRQHALNTKTSKTKTEHKIASDDEDSDTAELRLICLKSALLKKAIEMKQKQKLQKKLSQSNLEDDLFDSCGIYPNRVETDNNTDIESVDMDIGSDADEKIKDGSEEITKSEGEKDDSKKDNSNTSKEDELDEDEDLLRAKLLTSLSKNLPNLVNPEILNTLTKNTEQIVPKAKTVNVPEEKRFIIKLDESDSEGEHEATENLTKMHMKLSEQIDFQQKLDMFLKSTRMEVEKTKLPDVVQQQPAQKKPEKFVAKAVNHLPKSEQIEYKNLVKRMAELEKIKQSRQAAMNIVAQNVFAKDTLKPRNVAIPARTINNNIEEQITLSRKKIAEESAKMLKLKEEATKLSQKYKIVATELRNISTAITLNKKQQRSVQSCLTKIRLQHQSLLKSSTNSLHSKVNNRTNALANKKTVNKFQKENNPKDDYKNVLNQKTVKVSVMNDMKSDSDANTKLSVQIDVFSNKKTIKLPKTPVKDRVVVLNAKNNEKVLEPLKGAVECNLPVQEKDGESDISVNKRKMSTDDYISPLASIGDNTWKADPNAILCPFEVGGQCKDADCKYLHTHTTIQ